MNKLRQIIKKEIEVMNKVAGMPLNESEYQDDMPTPKQVNQVGFTIYKKVKELIDSEAGENLWKYGAEHVLNFYYKVFDDLKSAAAEDLADSINTRAGAAPDEY